MRMVMQQLNQAGWHLPLRQVLLVTALPAKMSYAEDLLMTNPDRGIHYWQRDRDRKSTPKQS